MVVRRKLSEAMVQRNGMADESRAGSDGVDTGISSVRLSPTALNLKMPL
jgi:hypothetical protein